MELPLFKGIGEEQLSLMLEKTSVEFLKFRDGEVIAEASTRVMSVDFILKGKVRNIYKLANYSIEIEEVLGNGAVLGATRLFGLDTNYGATGTAFGEVSLMRIEKSQYMNILLSDRIYMLNFVNYLSAAAQKGQKHLMNQEGSSVSRSLDILAYCVASRRAESVTVRGDDEALAKYCGVSIEEIEEFKKENIGQLRIEN